MWNPNISKDDGTVGISILHKPGEDPYEYEKANERCLPVHSVETIVISVISLLSDQNLESPLNVEAAQDFLNDKKEYTKKVRDCTLKSSYYSGSGFYLLIFFLFLNESNLFSYLYYE